MKRTNLNPEQLLVEEKYVKLMSQELDESACRYWIRVIYRICGYTPPEIVFLDNPKSMHLAVLENKNKAGDSLVSKVRDFLWEDLWDFLYDELPEQPWTEYQPLYKALKSKLGENIGKLLWEQLKVDFPDHDLRNYLDPSWLLVHLAVFEIGKNNGINFSQIKYDFFEGFLNNVYVILPCSEICFCSRRPTKINWEGDSLVSVRFADGWGYENQNH